MHSIPKPSSEPPHLRLLSSPRSEPASGAWLTLFGVLSFCAGHGIFLLTALTRLAKLPSTRELGGPLQIAVLAWFVAAAPLAIASLLLRARFLRLSARLAWSLASAAVALGLAACAFYLRAVALA